MTSASRTGERYTATPTPFWHTLAPGGFVLLHATVIQSWWQRRGAAEEPT